LKSKDSDLESHQGRFYFESSLIKLIMIFKRIKEGVEKKSFSSREMVKGNWQCADCGKEITELPFTPDPDRPVYCKDCWSKRRAQRFKR